MKLNIVLSELNKENPHWTTLTYFERHNVHYKKVEINMDSIYKIHLY